MPISPLSPRLSFLLVMQVAAFPSNVADEESVAKTVDAVVAKFGRLDIAINCAGIVGACLVCVCVLCPSRS